MCGVNSLLGVPEMVSKDEARYRANVPPCTCTVLVRVVRVSNAMTVGLVETEISSCMGIWLSPSFTFRRTGARIAVLCVQEPSRQIIAQLPRFYDGRHCSLGSSGASVVCSNFYKLSTPPDFRVFAPGSSKIHLQQYTAASNMNTM